MNTLPLLWLTFSFKDALDVFIVAAVLYYTYQELKNNGSKALFMGIFTFILIWVLVTQVFAMRLIGGIMDKFISVGFLILVVIFQDEIRKFLTTIGSTRQWTWITRIFLSDKHHARQDEKQYVAPLVLASMNMAKKKTGALIAVQGQVDLTSYLHTGEVFRADVNARLIENIFFKNSPLHDGAMIIVDGEIRSAGCILPVSSDPHLSKDLGLRHRSALGLSQASDALVIIISEERGKISIAHKGSIMVDISVEELREKLETL